MILWLALASLLTPVLTAVGLNQREARKAAKEEADRQADAEAEAEAERRREAEDERRRRDAETERRREEAEERRQHEERDYLIRGGGLRRELEQLQINEDDATRERTAVQKPIRERSQRLQDRAGQCEAALPQDRPAWAVTAAAVFGLVWIIAVGTNLFLDVQVFLGIGHGLVLAIPLAVLLVLGFLVVGLVLTDCIGFTHAVPGIDNLSRRVRIALSIGIAMAAVVCFSQLPQIVEHRSADVAAQVDTLQGQIAILKSANAPVQLLAQEERRLKETQDKLSAARKVDSALAIVAASTEMATSWAVIWLGILLAAEMLRRRAREAEDQADALQRVSDGAPDRIRAAVLARVMELHMTDEEVAEAYQIPIQGPLGLMPAEGAPDPDAAGAPSEDFPPAADPADDGGQADANDETSAEDNADTGHDGGGDPPRSRPRDGPAGSATGADDATNHNTTEPDPPDLFGPAI